MKNGSDVNEVNTLLYATVEHSRGTADFYEKRGYRSDKAIKKKRKKSNVLYSLVVNGLIIPTLVLGSVLSMHSPVLASQSNPSVSDKVVEAQSVTSGFHLLSESDLVQKFANLGSQAAIGITNGTVTVDNLKELYSCISELDTRLSINSIQDMTTLRGVIVDMDETFGNLGVSSISSADSLALVQNIKADVAVMKSQINQKQDGLPAGLEIEAMTSGSYTTWGMKNFKKKYTYTNTFKDVSSSEWYAKDVVAAYEYGLMSGKDSGKFDPNGRITIAEAISVAARIHNIYSTGAVSIANIPGGAWYEGAVKYAESNDIISRGEYSNYNAPATRAQFLSILKDALPMGDMTRINNVDKIPDMQEGAKYYDDILFMYNAGITAGADGYGTSNFNKNITRAEASAMFNRVVNKDARQHFTLKEKPVVKPPVIKPSTTKGGVVYVQNYDDSLGTPDAQRRCYEPRAGYNKIVTKYGLHTYNCANQQEYDKVVNIIEEVKNSPKYADYVNKFINNKEMRSDYIKAKGLDKLTSVEYELTDLGKMYILEDLLSTAHSGIMAGSGRLNPGNSAYNLMFEDKSDCSAVAMAYSAIYDIAGFNTRTRGGGSHEWVEIQVSSGKYFTNGGVAIENCEQDRMIGYLEGTQQTSPWTSPVK